MKRVTKLMVVVMMVISMVVSLQAKVDKGAEKIVSKDVKFTVVGDFILKPDGTLWAVGNNKNGRLSKEVKSETITNPIQIMTDVAFIGGKGYEEKGARNPFREAYILKQDGTLYLFGEVLEKVMDKVSVVDDYFIVDQAGKVYAWGYAQESEVLQESLGVSLSENINYCFWNKPEEIKGLTNVKQIAYEFDEIPTSSGRFVSTRAKTLLVLKKDGTLEGKYDITGCDNNSHITNGNIIKEIMKDVKSIECVGAVNMVVKNDNSLWGWGDTSYGAFGGGINQSISEPTKLLDNVKVVQASSMINLAVTNNGDLYTWGMNQFTDFSQDEGKFYKFPNGGNLDVQTTNGFYFVALKKDGRVWMYGEDPASEATEHYDEDGNYVKNSEVHIGGFGTEKGDHNIGSYGYKSAYPFKQAVAIAVEKRDGIATYALDKQGNVWVWGTKFKLNDGKKNASTRRPFIFIENK